MRLARRLAVPPVLTLLAASLAAGCGGGGGGAPPDTTAPTVTGTSPLDGATGVATSAAITVTFSEAMSGSSLFDSTFLVTRGATPVPGTVSHGSSTATFSPGSPLSYATTYTATVTTGATDAAGNPLEESHSWSFTTADPSPPPSGWSAQAIGSARNSADIDIYGVDVDLNEGGTGIAVWEEAWDDTMAGGVWVAWYRDFAWETAVRLNDPGVATVLPRVALNDAGDAIVAYEVVDSDSNGMARTIWTRRWVDSAWTAPERVSDPPVTGQTYAYRPRVGIDSQGRALVVWNQGGDVLGARFDGASWSGPFLVSGGDAYASWADAAVSAGGSAVVVWTQDTNPFDPGQSGGGPTIPNVWARVFDGSSWGDPLRIGNSDLGDYEGCERAAVVMDAAGRAFAIWEEHRSAENRIVSAWLDPAGPSWDAPATLASSAAPTDHLSFPSIATDGSGNAFAVWQSDVPAGSDSHGASARYDGAAGTWDAATFFETGGNVSEAVSAMDGTAGTANGWALFTRGGLQARRDDPALGWQDVSSLGSGYAMDAEANGSGMVIVGAHDWYYATTAFLVQARAAVYVP